MRIAIDATCWQNNRGYGRYARSLLTGLAAIGQENRYTFFLDSQENLESLPHGVEIRMIQVSSPTVVAAKSDGHRSARDLWRIARAMSSSDFDVVLFPTVYSYVPIFSRAKKVVIIHDVIADLYPQLTLPSVSARLFWRTKVALGRLQADCIVTISEFSRQGIADHFRIPPARIRVIGEASDPVFRRLDAAPFGDDAELNELGLDPKRPLVVYVGGFSPHKNLDTLVRAFANVTARDDFKDCTLVMVGEYRKEVFHSYYSTIKHLVAERGIADRVIFTGYLPDDKLVKLLNISTVCVLPSLIEGFGLPAVEAAACGCPVIATTASPLPGILGDGGLYIDPAKQIELEQALSRILGAEDLRRRMSAAGIAAAGRLSWDTAAQQMHDLLKEVVRA